MRRQVTALVVTAAVLATASSVMAQPGRGGPGGRGGFGGFGGGGVAGLMAMQEVQKELSISDEQKSKIETLMEELRPQPPQGGFGNFQDLSPEERQKRMAEMRKQGEEMAKKAEEGLKGILDAKQATRLGELRNQREGVRALTRADVAAKLELTDEQKGTLKELAEANPQFGFGGGGPGRGQGGAGGQGNPGDFQARMEEARKRQEKFTSDSMAVLTDAQKTKWESLQGKKFEFPAFGGPGGPGGGGNRPPRGNRPANE